MTTPGLRTLMLCADDFGHSPGISQAIAQLAHAQRLSATSCLSNGAHWRTQAEVLRGLPPGVQRGLHFNLTEGAPLSDALRRAWPQLPALPRLMLQAHARSLPQAAIGAELRAQLAAFSELAGQAPDYIDGHQHVHHLPGVREVLLDALGRMAAPPAVRSTARPLGAGFGLKRFLIAHTGGVALQRLLARSRIPHNPSLLGVYDFETVDYRALMQGWLAALPAEGGLLFCHPGAADAANDPIAPARVREQRYLASTAFSDDLAAAQVQLGPVWHINERSSAG
jgi:chitin disaccharide deacetylase